MRRVLLLLILIALLPLRAWAGDAMAIQMAAQAAHHSRLAVAAKAPLAHALCHEAQAEPTAPHTSPAQDHCETCASCQACFTVAITVPAMLSATQPLLHGLPHAGSAQFTSAILALGHKPPIS
jgi:Tfp pilus assembly protein PilX